MPVSTLAQSNMGPGACAQTSGALQYSTSCDVECLPGYQQVNTQGSPSYTCKNTGLEFSATPSLQCKQSMGWFLWFWFVVWIWIWFGTRELVWIKLQYGSLQVWLKPGRSHPHKLTLVLGLDLALVRCKRACVECWMWFGSGLQGTALLTPAPTHM